jgi:hypothetical protein
LYEGRTIKHRLFELRNDVSVLAFVPHVEKNSEGGPE